MIRHRPADDLAERVVEANRCERHKPCALADIHLFGDYELTYEWMIGWRTDHEPEPGGLGLLRRTLCTSLAAADRDRPVLAHGRSASLSSIHTSARNRQTDECRRERTAYGARSGWPQRRAPQDRRLGDGGSFARRTAIGGLSDGHCDTAAWCRPDPPFRSWRSIRFGGVSQDDAVHQLSGLDEPQGRLL